LAAPESSSARHSGAGNPELSGSAAEVRNLWIDQRADKMPGKAIAGRSPDREH
jgi:hypothetical protein